ncbi:MAG: LPS export ABC transporter periplasmic protein LptC [Candidatus Syntrophosphaera sp.]|nr:LPS export ABC transporter periplasmic protein LptC [Candidatus Syntrophosphaera sp.]
MTRPCRLISSSLFSCLALLLLLAACGDSNLDLATARMKGGLADETSTNVTITEFDEAGIAYILKAARIDRYYDRRVLNAYEVEITAYDKKGETSVLLADSTIVNDASNQIFAFGNVRLSSPGVKVQTSRLIWDRNMDEITAPDNVTLIREGNVLRGKNLRTNLSIYPTLMDSVSAEGYFGEDYLDW